MTKQTNSDHLSLANKQNSHAIVSTWDDGRMSLSVSDGSFSMLLFMPPAEARALAASLLSAAASLDSAAVEPVLQAAA